MIRDCLTHLKLVLDWKVKKEVSVSSLFEKSNLGFVEETREEAEINFSRLWG
jgi:hypothetical protein